MNNSTGVAQQVTLASDVAVLAAELRGTSGTMGLRVNAGVKLTARNGLRISSGGVFHLVGGEINTIREVDVRPGGRFEGEGLVNGQQAVIAGIPEFANKGLFEPHLVNQGVVSIASTGDSVFDAGRLLVQGDYTQTSSGVLHMDLFSTGGVAGLNFDQLAVTGKVELAGVLRIFSSNSQSYSLDAEFPLITAGIGLTGEFTTLIAPAVSSGLGWSVDYTLTGATLRVVQQPGNGQPPDYLAQWRHSYGLDAGGDLDNDGDTDGLDFLAWQRGVSPALPNVVSAPEPASALLFAAAISIVGVSRRRRSDR